VKTGRGKLVLKASPLGGVPVFPRPRGLGTSPHNGSPPSSERRVVKSIIG
jgi:hypothetical protein